MRNALGYLLVILLAGSLTLLPAVPQEEKEKSSSSKKEEETSRGDEKAGEKIYRQHCAVCHFASSTIPKAGPGLKGLFERKRFAERDLPINEKNVRKVILEGSPDPAMQAMPGYKGVLTEQQMDDLIAYLKTL